MSHNQNAAEHSQKSPVAARENGILTSLCSFWVCAGPGLPAPQLLGHAGDRTVTYSLALLVESSWEREPRRAMDRRGVASLPLYPEGQACRYATVPRLIEVFEGVQQHTLLVGTKPPVVFTTKLTRLQHQILSLLGMSRAYDG